MIQILNKKDGMNRVRITLRALFLLLLSDLTAAVSQCRYFKENSKRVRECLLSLFQNPGIQREDIASVVFAVPFAAYYRRCELSEL